MDVLCAREKGKSQRSHPYVAWVTAGSHGMFEVVARHGRAGDSAGEEHVFTAGLLWNEEAS